MNQPDGVSSDETEPHDPIRALKAADGSKERAGKCEQVLWPVPGENEGHDSGRCKEYDQFAPLRVHRDDISRSCQNHQNSGACVSEQKEMTGIQQSETGQTAQDRSTIRKMKRNQSARKSSACGDL